MAKSAPTPDEDGDDELTENERRFVEEYVIDCNATQAYFRAFGRYTTRNGEQVKKSYMATAQCAKDLLKKPQIQAEVKALAKEHGRRCGITARRVLREWAMIAFADPDDIYEPDEQNQGLAMPRPWRDIPPAARKAIASVKVKRKKLKGPKGEDDAWQIEELEYKTHSKEAALEKLGKHLGLLKDGAALEALLEILRSRDPEAGGAGDDATGDRKNVDIPDNGR